MRHRNPPSPPPAIAPFTHGMDAMDRVFAEMSPDNIAAALRLLNLLEECRQMARIEANAWRQRLTGCVRFNAVRAEAEPNA